MFYHVNNYSKLHSGYIKFWNIFFRWAFVTESPLLPEITTRVHPTQHNLTTSNSGFRYPVCSSTENHFPFVTCNNFGHAWYAAVTKVSIVCYKGRSILHLLLLYSRWVVHSGHTECLFCCLAVFRWQNAFVLLCVATSDVFCKLVWEMWRVSIRSESTMCAIMVYGPKPEVVTLAAFNFTV